MMKQERRLNGISRIDSGATHGWFIRVYRNGRTHSKFYSDLKYGGKNKALALAFKHRDELRARLGPPAPKARLKKNNRTNTTGVIGVSKTRRSTASGKITEFYTVSWRPERNVPKIRSFSISLHGEKKAFDLAVKFRKAQEKLITRQVEAGWKERKSNFTV